MTKQMIPGLADNWRLRSRSSNLRHAAGAAFVLVAFLPACSSSDSPADGKAGSSSSSKGGKSSAGGAKGKGGLAGGGEGGSGAVAGTRIVSAVAGTAAITMGGASSTGAGTIANGGAAPGSGGAAQTSTPTTTFANGGAVATGGATSAGGALPATGGVTSQAGASSSPQGGSIGVAGASSKPLLDLSRPECKACMDTWCTDEESGYVDPAAVAAYPLCSRLSGLAEDGPAAGTDRKKLCNTLFDCINKSRCPQVKEQAPYPYPETGLTRGADITIQPCYCGPDITGLECIAEGRANGACKQAYENALETTAPSEIVLNFTSDRLAGGHASLFFAYCASFCIEHCETR